jgi:hypothetical protein
MAQPIDYTPLDPFAAGLSGLKFGMGLAEVEQRQMLAEQQKRSQEQYQQAFARIQSPNATASDYENLMLLSGKDQAENIRKVLEGRDTRQNQNTLKQIGGVAFALKTGSPEQASMLLMRQAEAAQNSGDSNEAQYLRQMAELARSQPDNVGNLFASQMTFIPGGKEALDNLLKLTQEKRVEAKAPSDLLSARAKANQDVADAIIKQEQAKNAPEKAAADAAKAKADADKAAVDAKYAEQIAKLNIKKTEEDIIINRENSRIAALNAAIARETNVIRQGELRQKIDDAKEKRDAAERDLRANLESQSSDIDNFLNTAARIKQVPKNVLQSATGPIAARLPTVSQDVADLEAQVETLGSQAFLAQIPKIKGAGALSEKEGDKLQSSIQNLSLKQSPDQFLANLNEATRLMEKARTNLALRAGLISPPMDVPARQEIFVTLPDGSRAKFANQAAADNFKKKAGIP